MASKKSDDPRLDKYLAKRDFAITSEPTGGSPSPGPGPRFVIQQHAATRMHYDFRLEVDGVLASWAVPRGPSYDPQEKRLAVRTEDHPMDYAGFEGVIPKGEYGGGSVIVWDAGIFHNLTSGKRGDSRPMADGLERGHVKVWLEGEKLQGAWALTRTSRDGKDWLMVKVKDVTADPEADVVGDQTRSVLSGKTVQEVAEDAEAAVWHSGPVRH
jgi:DNA ligase D-like protein (predicted 3'-phosphoesterase)